MMNYCAYVPHCLPTPHIPMQEEPSYHPRGKRGRFAADRKAGSVRPPSNVWEMIATLTNEQQADAARSEHITKEARKDWDRDFGHTFPDLMAGPTPAEAAKYPLLAGRLT